MTEREWCEKIWPALTEVARRGEKTTYKELKAKTGFSGGQRTLSSCRGRIANYCRQHNLPILTSVVVNKTTGKPGSGIPFVEEFESELAKVHAFASQGESIPV